MTFFLTIPDQAFRQVFAQEWYVRMRAPESAPADHLV